MKKRFIRYNPNPHGKNVGDCTIRAISKAIDSSWEDVYCGLTAFGFELKDMPSANHVWGAYLKLQGFERCLIDDHNKIAYTVEDFCIDNPIGTYVLGLPGHVVCVVDGKYYDTWDSGNEVPIYYWRKR